MRWVKQIDLVLLQGVIAQQRSQATIVDVEASQKRWQFGDDLASCWMASVSVRGNGSPKRASTSMTRRANSSCGTASASLGKVGSLCATSFRRTAWPQAVADPASPAAAPIQARRRIRHISGLDIGEAGVQPSSRCAVRCCSAGRPSAVNQVLIINRMLWRDLGCDIGTTPGLWTCHSPELSVTSADAAPVRRPFDPASCGGRRGHSDPASAGATSPPTRSLSASVTLPRRRPDAPVPVRAPRQLVRAPCWH